jgi:hypothetical protein
MCQQLVDAAAAADECIGRLVWLMAALLETAGVYCVAAGSCVAGNCLLSSDGVLYLPLRCH